MVSGYLDAVMSLDVHSQAFADRMRDIGKLGNDDIRSAASVSNRLLDKPPAAMQNGGLTQTSGVSRSLLDLRHQMEDLDPSAQGDLFSELTAKIASLEATDPDRARVLKEDMLFPVRQKNQDLLTQFAVSIQGYLALDIIRRNNLELIRGVQRATTTTVAALRTAVIVAQALADQKLVLDQITAINTTTSNLIGATGQLLHQQSTDVNTQAASSTVNIAKLQGAFQNFYATMDEIDSFRVGALDSMRKTVDALSTKITKSQAYLDRVRTLEGPRSAAGTELPPRHQSGDLGAAE